MFGPPASLADMNKEGTSRGFVKLYFGRPACVGNNTIDVRRMDLGLKGDGVSLCGICQETLDDHTITDSSGSSVFGQQQEILVTLPCVHMFHDSCLAEWLQSDLGRVHWDCPTCRGRVHHTLATYRGR